MIYEKDLQQICGKTFIKHWKIIILQISIFFA